MEKGQKIANFAGTLLELILLISLVNLITLGFELIGERRFGVEFLHSEPVWTSTLNWSVVYFGILIMLYTTASPKGEYTFFGLVTIVIVEFIESSNILFLKILPEITWAKTGDFLIFLAGLAMLALFVLIVAFHHKIHELFIVGEETEEEEI